MRSNSHTHAPQSDIGLAPYITLGPMTTQVLRYHDGATVQLGDIVDVGFGSGPTARVVVIVPTSEAAPGFIADEWSYLKQAFCCKTRSCSVYYTWIPWIANTFHFVGLLQVAMRPNPSIERTSSSKLRLLPAAAHVER